MATASVPNTFVASTAADPDEVNANFTALVNFANNNTVHRDGSKAMTGAFDAGSNKIVNVSNGTNATDAVNKSQLDAITASAIPRGSVVMWGTDSPPSGWLVCNGDAVSRTTYAGLFALIGTTFGSGDGSTTFNLPDFSDRFPAGVGAADSDSFADALGQKGGSQNAVVVTHSHGQSLSVSSSGAHSHTGVSLSVSGTAASAGSHSHGYTAPVNLGTGIGSGTTWSDQPFSTGSAGAHTHSVSGTASGTVGTGSSAHTHSVSGTIDAEGVSGNNANLPPYLAIHFIIKV